MISAPAVAASDFRRRTHAMVRRILLLVLLMTALLSVWLVAREQMALDRLVERELAIRDWVERRPWRALAAGFGIYVLVSLVPGTTGKALIAGWIFGFWRGLLIVNLGLTVAAMLIFLASRHLLRDVIAARLGPRMERADRAIAIQGPRWLFTGRILHAPFWVTSQLMGTTRISTGGFWWATQLGLLPGNLVFVYAGAQAPTLAELAEHGAWSLLSPGLLAAFVVVTVVPVFLPRLVAWAVRRWRLTPLGTRTR
jgi:uncharacterized membrane protein YdjX (TVP38/TMEM64 family)